MNIASRWKEFRTSIEPTLRELRFMAYRVSQSPLSIAGIAILIFFALVAICAPILAPPPPGSTDPFTIPKDEVLLLRPGITKLDPVPPCERHPFGTTFLQYDLYYGCIWGTITAFRIGVLVVAAAMIFGIVIGTISGYYGGIVDEVVMRFTDIILAFPGLILAMTLVAILPPVMEMDVSLWITVIVGIIAAIILLSRRTRKIIKTVALVVFLGCLAWEILSPWLISFSIERLDKVLLALVLVGWPGYARIVRGEVLRIRNEDFVEAAKAIGCSDFRVIVKHILPNSIYPLLIMASLDTGAIVLTAAALSFLGLGARAGYADWGYLINLSRSYIRPPLEQYAHAFLIPGIFIFTFVLGWNLLGDAFRDILDPMLRRR